MAETDELGPVRALVCEDEPLARRAMEDYLADVPWIEVVAMAADGKEALRLIHKHEPDLVFLDVRMPGMSGVDVLDAMEHRPAVVFTTAFDEHAITAFEHGAVDYLVKPFGRDRLIRTLDRVRVRLVGEARERRVRRRGRGEEPGSASDTAASEGAGSPGYLQRIFAKRRGAIVPVPVADITRLEAVDGGVEIHTSAGTLTVDSTLGEVESRLDPQDFIRLHRAHVANLAHVKGIRRYDDRRMQVTLDDGSAIVASRAGSKQLKSLMG